MKERTQIKLQLAATFVDTDGDPATAVDLVKPVYTEDLVLATNGGLVFKDNWLVCVQNICTLMMETIVAEMTENATECGNEIVRLLRDDTTGRYLAADGKKLLEHIKGEDDVPFTVTLTGTANVMAKIFLFREDVVAAIFFKMVKLMESQEMDSTHRATMYRKMRAAFFGSFDRQAQKEKLEGGVGLALDDFNSRVFVNSDFHAPPLSQDGMEPMHDALRLASAWREYMADLQYYVSLTSETQNWVAHTLSEMIENHQPGRQVTRQQDTDDRFVALCGLHQTNSEDTGDTDDMNDTEEESNDGEQRD